MVHQFSEIPRAEIPRSSFDRSHGLKTTFDAGPLIPIFCDEALPGDTFNLKMTGFARMATPINPIMDNLFMETFFFAVPIRLIWDNWEKLNGAQDNPADSTDYLVPTTASPGPNGHEELSIFDYMGLPTKIPDLEHSVLWLRAYNLIFADWFKDQNLQNDPPLHTNDTPDPVGDYVLLSRNKRHDYFTSALPWPQKGDAVSLPLGEKAPVRTDGSIGSEVHLDPGHQLDSSASVLVKSLVQGTGSDLYADLSDATASTINELRQAFQVQRLQERDARGGTRYTEIIRSHFGVSSPDQRLQRPEFLGGGSSMVNINPVAQTSETVGTAQGNLAAYGTVTLNNHGFTRSFTEHCVILGLVNVRADLTYQQGLDRMWSRRTRFDFYWPALAQIGEQTILNKEIYAQGSIQATDGQVFGYQERYAEYRYKPSKITGLFRSNATASLDPWHLSQDFGDLPELNNVFIGENVPLDRVIAVPSEPHFLFDAYFSLRCARPMPLYGVPGMIDHF